MIVHFFTQIHEQPHQWADPLVPMVCAHRREDRTPQICPDYLQFSLFQFFPHRKFRQKGNPYLTFYQIFYGRDAPQLNGMVQTDGTF